MDSCCNSVACMLTLILQLSFYLRNKQYHLLFLQHLAISFSAVDIKREAITKKMSASDSDLGVVQLSEANSPTNSETSSSSDSSTESDANDLDSTMYSTNEMPAELNDRAVKRESSKVASSPATCMTVNHCDSPNGIITLTTTPSTHSVSSPPPSDQDEDDMQGDESDVQGSIDAYALEERMHSLSDPNSRITAVLQNSSAVLWRQFDALGTEMIVTRRGR